MVGCWQDVLNKQIMGLAALKLATAILQVRALAMMLRHIVFKVAEPPLDLPCATNMILKPLVLIIESRLDPA